MAELSAKTDIRALENEIHSYEERLSRLKMERTILQSQRDTVSCVGKTVDELKSMGDNLFSVVEGQSIDLQSLHVENIHRLTGVTGFELAHHRGFGIRFEMFQVDKSFGTPHYLILREDNKGKLNLFRHTIPAYVPLRALARKYLNVNLFIFVIKVRQSLYRHLFKQHLFLGKLPHTVKVQVDGAFRLVKLHLTDNVSTVMLVCNRENVERAMVVQVEEPGNEKVVSRRWLPSLTGPLSTFKQRLESLETVN